jgi:hypothetical protein
VDFARFARVSTYSESSEALSKTFLGRRIKSNTLG